MNSKNFTSSKQTKAKILALLAAGYTFSTTIPSEATPINTTNAINLTTQVNTTNTNNVDTMQTPTGRKNCSNKNS